MITIRLSGKPKPLLNDPLNRQESGFRKGLSEQDYWDRARGLWRMDERRALAENHALILDNNAVILSVAEITGISKFGKLRALDGNVLMGHPLVGRECPLSSSSRNPISYFNDLPSLAVPVGLHQKSAVDMQPLSAPLKVVSLFSGAGGLDVGFSDPDHYQLLCCVEFNSSCCDTLRANRDAGRLGDADTRIVQADLSKLDPSELMDEMGVKAGDIDLIIGGPPCQSWSTTGKRGTVQDARGMLVWHFLRFVEAFQPQYFVMENVRGILSAAFKHRPIALRPERGGKPLTEEEVPGSAIRAWLDDATSMIGGSYRVDYYEVNSVNYGSAEIRERVLFFGNRRGQHIDFPNPTHGPKSESRVPYCTLRDALHGLRENDGDMEVLDFSPRKKRFLGYVPEGGNWRAMPESIQRESMGKAFFAKGGRSGWWRRLSWDLPSPTIVTMPNHASTSLCHPSETRALSVAECARIQGFPDDWEFQGTVLEKMRQVGNAVPIRLAEVAGNLVFDAAMGKLDVDKCDYPRTTHRYIESMVRTRKWYKDGVTYLHGEHGDIPIQKP